MAILMGRACGGFEILAKQYPVIQQLVRFQRRLSRWIKVLGGAIAIAVCCIGLASDISWAQTDQLMPPENGGSASEEAAPSVDAETPKPEKNPMLGPIEELAPPEVRALFESDGIDAEVAPIYLDGRVLFEVAAPADGSSSWTAADRANQIENRLQDIARDVLALDSIDDLEVNFQIDQESNQPVIYVNGQILMTVTYLDATQSVSNSLTLRAAEITQKVREALISYYRERQPDFLWRQVQWAAAAILVTLLSNFALVHFVRSLEGRVRALKEEQMRAETTPNLAQTADQNTVDMMRTTLMIRQKIKGIRVLEQVLQVLQVALWAGSILIILGFFPYTRWLQPLLVKTLRIPVRFIFIALGAYGLIRLADVGIDRLFVAFQTRTAATLERSHRIALRLSTFSHVVKGIVAVLIGTIAFFFLLSLLGVQVAPLLAGAGLVGVAISFASQSLIKDIINGFLILLEDQYGVGDVIVVKNVAGFVENMNLRITQLRDTGGQLITVPNGQIDIVQNLSKEWSRVDLMIPVGLSADVDQALHLVEQVAVELSRDAVWGMLILEPPLLLGVDSLDHVGTTIRLWIKTQPLKQWDVAREYRRRLKIAFAEAQIPIGVPQQVIHLNGGGNSTWTTTAGKAAPPYSNGTMTNPAETAQANPPV